MPARNIRHADDCVPNMFCLRRSFKLEKNEKFYLTIVFKSITNENVEHCTYFQRTLSSLSRDIIFSRAREIADDFGDFLVLFQDFVTIEQDGRLCIGSFQNNCVSYEMKNYLCDVFRLKPLSKHSTFLWDARLYNLITTLCLDDFEGFRTHKNKRWDWYLYLSGLPNLGPYDYNCNRE